MFRRRLKFALIPMIHVPRRDKETTEKIAGHPDVRRLFLRRDHKTVIRHPGQIYDPKISSSGV
jgi:hypothetical protein